MSADCLKRFPAECVAGVGRAECVAGVGQGGWGHAGRTSWPCGVGAGEASWCGLPKATCGEVGGLRWPSEKVCTCAPSGSRATSTWGEFSDRLSYISTSPTTSPSETHKLGLFQAHYLPRTNCQLPLKTTYTQENNPMRSICQFKKKKKLFFLAT